MGSRLPFPSFFCLSYHPHATPEPSLTSCPHFQHSRNLMDEQSRQRERMEVEAEAEAATEGQVNKGLLYQVRVSIGARVFLSV